jgi:type VI secretion system protein ImpC
MPEETTSRELPFTLGILADLSGDSRAGAPGLQDRKFIMVYQDNFDAVQAAICPKLSLEVPNRLGTGPARLRVNLRFSNLSDFEPAAVARQVPALRALPAGTAPAGRARTPAADAEFSPLLDGILQQTEARTPHYQVHGPAGFATDSDRLRADQLDEILCAPEFQRLKATWRGLRYLVDQAGDKPDIKVFALDVSRKELLRDFQKSASFDETWIFKKVHDDVFDVLGCWPFGALIGDYEIGNHPEDLELLWHAAEVAAATGAPFVASASPQMFGVEKFDRLPEEGDLQRALEGPAHARWRSFRAAAISRYAALVLPRVLFPPLDPAGGDSTHTWGNAAYVFAAQLIKSHCTRGDFIGICGVDRAGTTDLRSIEVSVAERQARQLSDFGFLPLAHIEEANWTGFVEARPCHKPARYASEAATADARLASDLRCVLAVSRFVQYVKVQMIEMSHSGLPAREYVPEIDQWLKIYAENGMLREARLELRPGTRPQVALHLLPNLGAEKLNSPIRLVMDVA